MGATILLGVAANIPEREVFAWASSFRRVGRRDARIILVAQPDTPYRRLAARYDVDLRPSSSLWRDAADLQSVCKDRWDEVASVLATLDDDTQVLVTDVRDVVFQRDPFQQIRDGITVATEGLRFEENEWATDLTRRYFPSHEDLLAPSRMICAGVWAAPVPVARDLVADVYELARTRPGVADQHCLNVVLRTKYGGAVHEIPYRDAWACHCSLMYGPDQRGPRSEIAPAFRNGQVYAGDKLFAIVHQTWWGRWPEFKAFYERPALWRRAVQRIVQAAR